MVDGCDVSMGIAFHQGPDDSYGKVSLSKLNLFTGSTLVLERPAGPATFQTVPTEPSFTLARTAYFPIRFSMRRREAYLPGRRLSCFRFILARGRL